MDKNTYNMYFQNIQRGRFDRPFVDAALSLGDRCTSSADSLDWDVWGAAEYYSRARFVAQMRVLQNRDAKDKSLLEKAERSMSLLLKERPIKPENKVTWADISCLFEGFCESDTLSAQVAPLDDNTFRLSFTTTDEKKMFICIPSLDICGLYSAFSVVSVMPKVSVL